MRPQVLACSNCDLGAADRYWWLVGAGLLICVVTAIVLLLRLQLVGNQLRLLSLAALVVLMVGIGLSLSALGSHARVHVDGNPSSCSSALTSAETRGVPTDAALDPDQLACRQAGRYRLRQRLPLALSVTGFGFVASVICAGISLRPRKSALPGRAAVR